MTAAALAQLQLDAPLYIVNSSAVLDRFPNARCLDGSRPAFYWRKAASDASANKWRIHSRGGGWCQSIAACAARAMTNAGSSSYSTPFFNGSRDSDWGIMGANEGAAGDFNMVFTVYCDGSSYTGLRDEPVPVPPDVAAQLRSEAAAAAAASGRPAVPVPSQLYFRGGDVMPAIFAFLEELAGLQTRATDVILTGTSAGGLSTYINAPALAALLPASADVVAVPDAGAFVDIADVYGAHSWAASLQESFSLWNASVGAACAAARAPTGDAWRCLLPEVAYAASAAPRFFVVQSLVDPTGAGIVIRLPCSFAAGKCNSSMLAELERYSGAVAAAIEGAQAGARAGDGRFLTTCAQHEETCADSDWGAITIGGETMGEAFEKWRTRSGDPADWRRTDVAWPGDASCTPAARHGGC